MLVRYPGKLLYGLGRDVLEDTGPHGRHMATISFRCWRKIGWFEANVPYAAWLDAARRRPGGLQWLVQRFESLPVSLQERSELYRFAVEYPVRSEAGELAGYADS